MIPDLLRYNKSQKYILYDYETENVNLLTNNKPWQVGWVEGVGDKIVDVVNEHIDWPDLDISEDAARITKFDRAKYDRLKKPARPILDRLQSYLDDPEYIILTHNGIGFDIYLHQLYRKKLGLPVDYKFLSRFLDTNSLSKAYKLGVKTINRKNGYAECLKYTNYIQKGLKTSLSTMAKELGVDYNESDLHDAEKDVIINWAVWNKLIWVIEI